MKQMKRYAIYYAPAAGAFADFTAAWLGWDLIKGRSVARPVLDDLPQPIATLTAPARKYGFHGTLMAPFRLADPQGDAALHLACTGLAATLTPITLPGLRLQALGGFLALTPDGDATALTDITASILRHINPLRAQLTPAEIARRRPETLTPRQRALLDMWGYPYVMEEFQFHLTLTGPLSAADLATTAEALAPHLLPILPRPFTLQDFCLCGEDDGGMFHIIRRYAFSG